MMPGDRLSTGSVAALRELEAIAGPGVGGAASPAVQGPPGPAPATMPTEAPGIIVAEVAPCDDTADISVAARALIDLQVAVPVVDRLCDAMIAATSDRGAVPGTLVLQLAVDGGVTGLVALQLRERLGISASVPVPPSPPL